METAKFEADNKEAARLFSGRLLDLGSLLLASGSEVWRVEDTISRLGTAFGARRMDVFVITSSISATLQMPDGRDITETRRVTRASSTDFLMMENINALSRRFCEHPMSAKDFAREVDLLRGSTQRSIVDCAAQTLVAGAYAIFFGGGPVDCAAAAIVGALVFLMSRILRPITPNQVIYNLIASFISGLVIYLISRIVPSASPDEVMIGVIMLLIPGLSLTNAVRDMITGDTITGFMRFVEALLWAGALACGFMLSIMIAGTP